MFDETNLIFTERKTEITRALRLSFLGWEGYCKMRDKFDETIISIKNWEKQKKSKQLLRTSQISTDAWDDFRHIFLDEYEEEFTKEEEFHWFAGTLYFHPLPLSDCEKIRWEFYGMSEEMMEEGCRTGRGYFIRVKDLYAHQDDRYKMFQKRDCDNIIYAQNVKSRMLDNMRPSEDIQDILEDCIKYFNADYSTIQDDFFNFLRSWIIDLEKKTRPALDFTPTFETIEKVTRKNYNWLERQHKEYKIESILWLGIKKVCEAKLAQIERARTLWPEDAETYKRNLKRSPGPPPMEIINRFRETLLDHLKRTPGKNRKGHVANLLYNLGLTKDSENWLYRNDLNE